MATVQSPSVDSFVDLGAICRDTSAELTAETGPVNVEIRRESTTSSRGLDGQLARTD